jgi:hypothetical protein
LWGGRFQPLKIEGDQEAGGNGRKFFGPRRLNILWIWKVFGLVISFGSGQVYTVSTPHQKKGRAISDPAWWSPGRLLL